MSSIRPTRLAQALFDLRTDPPVSLICVFFMGALITGIASNFVYEWIKWPNGFDLEHILPRVVLGLSMLVVVAGFALSIYLRQANIGLRISEKSNVPSMCVVISALSPYRPEREGDNLDNIRRLINHHRSSLQELFLVAVLHMDDSGQAFDTRHPDSRGVHDAYDKLVEWLDTQNFDPRPILRIVEITDSNSAEPSFERVAETLNNLVVCHADLSRVVIDLTAGTKAMAAGLIAAAMTYGCSVSYQATKRGIDGQPEFAAGATSMVLLDSAFVKAKTLKASSTVRDRPYEVD